MNSLFRSVSRKENTTSPLLSFSTQLLPLVFSNEPAEKVHSSRLTAACWAEAASQRARAAVTARAVKRTVRRIGLLRLFPRRGSLPSARGLPRRLYLDKRK